MPIVKPAVRAPRQTVAQRRNATIENRRRWGAFSMLWARVASHLRALELHHERDRYYALWDYRNQLVEAHNAIETRCGKTGPAWCCTQHRHLLWALRAEIRKTEDEAAVYTEHGGLDTFRERAFDGDTVDDTAEIVLLMHGVRPYRLDKTTRNKTAERNVERVRAWLKRDRDSAAQILADLNAGRQFYGRAAPITPERVTKEISRLDAKLSALPAKRNRCA